MEKALKLYSHNFFDTETDLLCISKDLQSFQFISQGWEKVLGWKLEELNAKKIVELLHPEDVKPTAEILELTANKIKIYGFENRYISSNKQIKWLEWRIFFEGEEDPVFIGVARDITPLKEKDHYLKLSQHHANLGTWAYHVHSRKLTCSDEFLKIYETTTDEKLTYPEIGSFYQASSWQTLDHAFQRCLKTGESWNLEVEVITEKGTHKWVQSWGFPLKIGEEIIGVEGMILDLTKRKKEELTLKQRVEELDKLQLSINEHCLVARLDSSFNFISINHIFQKISGHSQNELVQKNLLDLAGSKKHQELFKKIERHLSKGQKWRGEYRHVAKDGSYFWVDMSLTPIMDLSTQQVREIIYISYDITEKKVSDERYQTVLSGINAGIWDHRDLSKDDVYWSSRLYEILGYQAEEYPNPTASFYYEMLHPEDRAMAAQAISAALNSNDTSFLLEFRLLRGNKQYLWVQSLGIIMRDDEGKAYRMIGSIIDIHQKKLMEFNLEEEKSKTIQSSKLATLGEMAASLAHEVNNPLTIIFGYIRILEEELLNPNVDYHRLHRHIGLIKNAAERAAKIVTNLKDFARDGAKDPSTEIPASQLISGVLDLCSERFKKNGIRIDLEIDDDPLIHGRKIELSQVLLNLLFNSFDALEEQEEKWVKITAQACAKQIEMSVIDSGQGLATEVAEKVFTPFFTTKKVGLGTGIGLSISQRIILNHGGEIFYDSSHPHTRFVIRLPFPTEMA